MKTLQIQCDISALTAALDSLPEVSELSREVVERLLSGFDGRAQLVRIHVEDAVAGRTGDLRIALQPSNFLVDLLAAVRASERN